jgi:murein DD-endopeptidase MepM/ murein hydrolase activator NlpD
MKLMFLLSSLLPLVTCASQSVVYQGDIHPGEVRVLKFEVKDPESKLFCRGLPVRFSLKGKQAWAILIETYFSDLTPYTCVQKKGDTVLESYSFKVVAKYYEAEYLKVDMKKIKLNTKDQKRADEEQLVLNKIYASSHDDFFFKVPFQEPMTSFKTSIYGKKRVYNNHKKGQHLGIDYRAAIGEKVPATNRGKVVLARDLFYTGWTVLIDHGLDVFTNYGHLSKALVSEGTIVEKGDVIGLSGNTGRTSGPHLHWGVKIQGQYVDGMSLILETEKTLTNDK